MNKEDVLDMIQELNEKQIDRFRRTYIKPLLEQDRIKRTIPEQPRNRNQKYISY